MFKGKKSLCLGLGIAVLLGFSANAIAHNHLTRVERLGKAIFHDQQLSEPAGEACASCHGKQTGFTGPSSAINRDTAIYPGAMEGRFGNRKPPAAAYAGDVPELQYDDATSSWMGGLFWDGRATGYRLGDPLAEQAIGPFLNPLEQNNPDAQTVCEKVKNAFYSYLFDLAWGDGALDCENNTDDTYDLIGRSIAAYERSAEVNPYSSKYDYYLSGQTTLSDEELLGLELFDGAAGCASCHSTVAPAGGEHPLFTDFGYDNLGVPRNENNPFYTVGAEWNPDGEDWIDPGLGATLQNLGYAPEVYEPEWGKHRVPTLRNVALKPSARFHKVYGHNGYFGSLREIVHFYNTRDVPGEGWMGVPWPPAEVPSNMNDTLGDLGLTASEEQSIVAFLETLSDGYCPW